MLLSSLAPFLILLLLDTGGAIPTYDEKWKVKRINDVYNPSHPEPQGFNEVVVPQSNSAKPPAGLPQPQHYWAGAGSSAQLKKRQAPPPPPSQGQPPSRGSDAWVEGPKAKELWRGEIFRTPEDVQKVSGFDSHAKRIFEGKHPDYPEGMTKDMFHKGSSLYEHGTYKNPFSHYVPTSTSMGKAKEFAMKPDPGRPGYIYKIRPSPDMVDVSASLGGDRHYKNFHEDEVAGVYDIAWKQVEGWHKLTYNPTTKDYEVGKFVQNEKFAPVSDAVTYSSQPSLAGFPEGHLAWGEKRWASFKDTPVEGMLNEHLLKYRFNNDVGTFNQLRPSPWGDLPSSGLHKRGGQHACTLIRDQPHGGNREGEGNGDAGKGPTEEKNGLEKTKTGEVEVEVKRPAEIEPISETDLIKSAEAIAEKEFAELSVKYGITAAVEKKWRLSPSGIRAKLQGYKKLNSAKVGFGGLSKLGSAALGAAGAGLWINGVVDAFVNNANDWDKAAAVTAIVPVVGCSVQAVADAVRGETDELDTLLCLLGDSFLVSGVGAPFGIAIHIVRWLRKSFALPPTAPTTEQMRINRDTAWKDYLQRLNRHLYSGNFGSKLQDSISAETAAVVYESSQAIAVLKASTQKILEAATTDEDREERKREMRNGADGIQNMMSTEIVHRQRHTLFNLTSIVKDSLTNLADEYNRNFTDSLISEDTIRHYTNMQFEGILGFLGMISGAHAFVPRIKRQDVIDMMSPIRSDLLNQSPPTPNVLQIAYLIGRSARLGLHQQVLSLEDYSKSPESPLNSKDRENTLNRARQDVPLVIQGKLDEATLTQTSWHKNLRILVAFGLATERSELPIEHLIGPPCSTDIRGGSCAYPGWIYDGDRERCVKIRPVKDL